MENLNPSDFSILMVDDTPKNLQVLGSTLKNEKYKLEFATDGMKALEWLKKKYFDLILLDVMMPGMSGFDVCKKIREDKDLNDTPIIFLTAKTDKESIVKGFELGAQDYVTKPFDTKELLARVKTQLELKYSREKLKSVNNWLENEVAQRTKELAEANEKLDEANKELVNLDKAKSEFLRMISHEIRTPLNGILGPLHLLKDKIESEDLMKLITILDNSVARLEKYSMTALKITELKSQKLALDIKPVNPKEIMEFCTIELSNNIKEKNIQLDIGLADENSILQADYDLLLECFMIILENLIANFHKEGNIKIDFIKNEQQINVSLVNSNIKATFKEISSLMGLTTAEDDITKHPGMDLYLAKLILSAHDGDILISENDDNLIIDLIFQLKNE